MNDTEESRWVETTGDERREKYMGKDVVKDKLC